MKKIINKIFAPKTTNEQLNFSELIAENGKLVVFFPEDIAQMHLLLRYLKSWEDTFTELELYIPEYSCSYVKNLETAGNVKIKKLNETSGKLKNCIIFNFSGSLSIAKYLTKTEGCLIMDETGNSGIKFVPKPESNVEMLLKFADFFNYKIKKCNLRFMRTDNSKITSQFYDNKFKDFTLQLKSSKSMRFADEIIRTMKLQFSANMYLYGTKLKKDDYPNLKMIEAEDLLHLCEFALVSDLFFTDDAKIAKLMADLPMKLIYLGKEENKTIKNVEIKDVFELKNIVNEMLND